MRPKIQLSAGAEDMFIEAFVQLHNQYFDGRRFSELYELALAMFQHVYGTIPANVPKFEAALKAQHVQPAAPVIAELPTSERISPRTGKPVRSYRRGRRRLVLRKKFKPAPSASPV